MKTKDKKLLHEKNLEELKALVRSAKDEIFSSKLDMKQNRLKNTRYVFLKRKEIARLLTIIRGKELSSKKKS